MKEPKWTVQYDCKQTHSRLYEIVFGEHWGSYREDGMPQSVFEKETGRWVQMAKDGVLRNFQARCSDGRTIGGSE